MGLNALQEDNVSDVPSEGDKIPAEIDWVSKGVVSMVRDQTRSDWVVCASDYAIAAIASIESSYMAAMNLTGVRLSAQQIMDCTGLQCQGGSLSSVFQYAQLHPLYLDSGYPYTGEDGTCHQNHSIPVSAVQVDGYNIVPNSDHD